MTKKTLYTLIAALLLLCILSGCADVGISSSKDAPDAEKSAVITLEGDKVSRKGGGVSVDGTTVTISAAGDYTVTGTLNDGRIVVNTGDDPGRVRIVLNNADMTNTQGPVIQVQQAKDLRIYLEKDSQNRLCSGIEGMVSPEGTDSNGAVIFSEDDMDIEGEGALQIFGYINNGITGKDDVDINSGNISIYAANNGIKGSESVDIKGGSITITAGNDGIKSSSANKAGKGYIHISAGNLVVNCSGDGIAAETELTIDGGNISVTTSGDAELSSCKALKAKTALTVNGGVITLTSADHAIHSAAGLTINGGVIGIVSDTAKGIAAHGDMNLVGGSITVNVGDDGIETEGCISISGGSYSISAGNNGIKAGFTGTGFETDNGLITISGGEILLNAAGDAIDAKGAVTVNGGSIFALGLSKSFKGFDKSSAQPFIGVTLNGSADSEVFVDDWASLTALWDFNTILFSSPELKTGTEYSITAGNRSASATA